MSQTIKCPKCSALIDVDEQIRKDAENKVRKEFNEEEKSKLENKLINSALCFLKCFFPMYLESMYCRMQ